MSRSNPRSGQWLIPEEEHGQMRAGSVTLFLCGDVMTGRGVDQILPHPGDPRLWESYVKDARTYVSLAAAANGPVPRPVDVGWLWGDALGSLDAVAPDVRVINLETSITHSDDVADGKAVHYRMNPDNIGCLTVAKPDVCALANNHVLDFGHRGLAETLSTLATAHLRFAGAGSDIDMAQRPAVVPVPSGHRVLVFSFGTQSAGIPPEWAATPDRAGVDLLPDLSPVTADTVTDRVRQIKQAGDVVVASIHWGPNWGYDVSPRETGFAHRLIDGGVDVIHGHSSHHPRPIEIYNDKLILYGCGDFVDDYEGIDGYDNFRDDLRLLYYASLAPESGQLTRLHIVPTQARQLRLHHASTEDAHYLCDLLNRISHTFETILSRSSDNTLELTTKRG